jgi:hypothetical protein
MATTNSRDWIFTHAFSESSFKSYEKNGLARRDTVLSYCCRREYTKAKVISIYWRPRAS